MSDFFVDERFAVSVTFGSPPGLSEVFATLGVVDPSVRGVVLVVEDVLASVPVALSASLPRISKFEVCPAGKSASATLPVHGFQVVPPSVEYSGF